MMKKDNAEVRAETGGTGSAPYVAGAEPSADGRMIMLDENIAILTDKPRSDLSSHGTPAFMARDRRLSGEQFALICERSMLPRVTSLGSYRSLRNPHILRLVDAGVVDWKPLGQQRLALVFEVPSGKKLLSAPEEKPVKLSEERIMTGLIVPVLSALSDFRNADIVHGAINAENIFLTGVPGAEVAILGECLSCAPSLRQHALYETIERGMAQPSGRGQGTFKDDLYALGVCVAMALRGENPMAGKDAGEIIRHKIEHGSYGVMVGRERIHGSISEFLRGVLSDDEFQRWDVEDALKWMEGRRLGLKQPRISIKASRPFVFREEKFWELRGLSKAFADQPGAAHSILEGDQFDLWIKRNFEDKVLEARLERVWEKERNAGRDKFLTHMCMALDPLAPVHYKGISIFPSGLGTALAETVAKGGDIQPYGEMISLQLLNAWINLRFDEIPDATGLITALEKCRGFLTQKIPGYGIERIIYMLNKETACLSPVLRGYFVLAPAGLLAALEAISVSPNRPENVLDRHMIAFLSVREPRTIDPHLGHVVSMEESFRVIGLIRTLAAIQQRFRTAPVPGLCRWVLTMMGTAIDRYNDRDLRQQLSRDMNKLADSGDMSALLDLVDNGLRVQDDSQRFKLARNEYARLMLEKEAIEKHLNKRKNFGRGVGQQTSMLVSSILSSLLIIGFIIMHFMQGGG